LEQFSSKSKQSSLHVEKLTEVCAFLALVIKHIEDLEFLQVKKEGVAISTIKNIVVLSILASFGKDDLHDLTQGWHRDYAVSGGCIAILYI
jgi:hypothetical protein